VIGGLELGTYPIGIQDTTSLDNAPSSFQANRSTARVPGALGAPASGIWHLAGRRYDLSVPLQLQLLGRAAYLPLLLPTARPLRARRSLPPRPASTHLRFLTPLLGVLHF